MKITENITTLITEYTEKYEREPNAILINEEDLWRLIAEERMNNFLINDDTIFNKKTYVYRYQGLEVIPIRYGKTQVVEILIGEEHEN